MNPTDPSNDSSNEGEPIENEINDEDVLEEIILGDDDNIIPEDDGDDNGDISDESEDEEDMNAELNEENLDLPVAKFLHEGEVYSIKFNPTNPRIFASGAGDDTAKIWNLDDGNAKSLTGHTDSVCDIQFSPDGKTLATCGLDAVLKLWDLNGNLLHSLEGPTQSIECCAWHPKGPIIIAGGGDGTAWMWDTRNGDCMGVFSGHSDSIGCISFSSDGKRIITGSADCTMRIWDPKTSATLHTIKEGSSALKFHEGPITAMKCYTNDLFVAGSEDGVITICNSLNGSIFAAYLGHSDSVESLEFLPGLNCVATASMDKSVQIFDLTTALQRSKITFEDGVVRVLVSESSPHHLFVACLDGSVSVWDYRSATLIKKFTAHNAPILDINVSSSGILSASEDGSIKLWSL
jgi:ribosome assembly protein SQT1